MTQCNSAPPLPLPSPSSPPLLVQVTDGYATAEDEEGAGREKQAPDTIEAANVNQAVAEDLGELADLEEDSEGGDKGAGEGGARVDYSGGLTGKVDTSYV